MVFYPTVLLVVAGRECYTVEGSMMAHLHCVGLSLMNFFFESRILTCLTYTSRRGSQHRGQTSEQEDTKARKAKLQRPRTAAQGSLSHKQQAKQANKGPDRTLEL